MSIRGGLIAVSRFKTTAARPRPAPLSSPPGPSRSLTTASSSGVIVERCWAQTKHGHVRCFSTFVCVCLAFCILLAHGRSAFLAQRLSVRFGNILAETTDAIVNAANGHLAHGGGLAGAIVRAGGRKIQEESDSLIYRMGELKSGSAVHTSAGTLPFKYIIHAVGPVWHGGLVGEPAALRRAVRASLELAELLRLNSIAIPAISSGIFGYPLNLATQEIVGAVRDWCETDGAKPEVTLKDIRLTNFDNPTVQAVEAAFCKVFPDASRK